MRKNYTPARILTLKNVISFFIIYYSVGVFGISLNITRELFTRLLPFSLIISMTLLFWFHSPWKPRHMIIFIIIAIAGFMIEVAGVLTGDIFGQYQYHNVLGPKVSGTPILIGFNWLMLIYCSHVILRKELKWPPLPGILAGALLMVVYDFFMEPVAITIQMWTWQSNQVPVQNYLAWFVISVILLSLSELIKTDFQNKLAKWLFFIQLLFFVSLNIIFRII